MIPIKLEKAKYHVLLTAHDRRHVQPDPAPAKSKSSMRDSAHTAETGSISFGPVSGFMHFTSPSPPRSLSHMTYGPASLRNGWTEGTSTAGVAAMPFLHQPGEQ